MLIKLVIPAIASGHRNRLIIFFAPIQARQTPREIDAMKLTIVTIKSRMGGLDAAAFFQRKD